MASFRVGFKPTVRLSVQRFSSSKILVPACAVLVTECVPWFAVFTPMILPCGAWYRPVSRSWFAIWFANFTAYVRF